MIKLSKAEKPQVLVDLAEQWTNEYLDCLRRDEKPSETIKTEVKTDKSC